MRSYPAPHSKDWFDLFDQRNFPQASIVRERIRSSLEACTSCGTTARTEDYVVIQTRDYPLPTLKLCDECHDEHSRRGLVRGPYPLPPDPPSPPRLKKSKVALRGIAIVPSEKYRHKASETAKDGSSSDSEASSNPATEGSPPRTERKPLLNKYPAWCTTCLANVPPLHGQLYPKLDTDGQVIRKSNGNPEWECDCRPRRPTLDQRSMLILRTAARRDLGQNLLFGDAILRIPGEPESELLFCGPDIGKREFASLEKYAEAHGIELLALSEFLELFHDAAWEAEALVCGWDLAFDVSRLAWKFGERAPRNSKYHNGFTIYPYKYKDPATGKIRPDAKRPSILAKKNEAASWIEFSHPKDSNKPKDFRGNFITLSDLAAALSGDRRTAREACLLFNAPVGPDEFEVPLVDKVTPEAIERIRHENRALVGLTSKLVEEFGRHLFSIPITKLRTAARMPKEYLREAGIIPHAKRQKLDDPIRQELERRKEGAFASSCHGGDTRVMIRNMLCPVKYYDFTKAYATSFIRQGLNEFLSAEKIHFVDGCVEEVNQIIQTIAKDPSLLFDPATYKDLNYVVQLILDGDTVPVRVQAKDGTWYSTIAPARSPNGEPLYFTLADVLRAVICRTSSRLPKLLDAIKIVPEGKLSSLRPTNIRGQVIDPRRGDKIFKSIVETVQRIKQQPVEPGTPEAFEAKRLIDSLKIIGNIGAFGIFSQTNPDESSDKKQEVRFYSNGTMIPSMAPHPELPGEFYFAPFAALVPAGVRLLMGLLEQAFRAEGGSIVFTCIDCVAIVATPKGGYDGLLPNVIEDLKREGITPLSYSTVEATINSFESLNPYDKTAVKALLAPKLDAPGRQLYCRATDINLHAFFQYGSDGEFHLLDDEESFSEHTLGCYENPKGGDTDPSDWIRDVWEGRAKYLESIPAIQKFQVSSRNLMDRVLPYNEGRPFYDQIKPFNLYSKCEPKATFTYEQVPGLMIAPYNSDPDSWSRSTYLSIPPVDHKRRHRITKKQGEMHPPYFTNIDVRYNPPSQEVQSYADIARKCLERPEYRSSDRNGNECVSGTRGVIYPTPVEITGITHLGRENNERGLINLGMARADQVYQHYGEIWNEDLQREIESHSAVKLGKAAGYDPRQIRRWQSGSKVPSQESCERLKSGIKKIRVKDINPDEQEIVAQTSERNRSLVRMLDLRIGKLGALAGIDRETASRFMRGDSVTLETIRRIDSAVTLYMKLMECPHMSRMSAAAD